MLERKGGYFLTPRHPGHPSASLLGADGLPSSLLRLPIVARANAPLQGSGPVRVPPYLFPLTGYGPCLALPLLAVLGVASRSQDPSCLCWDSPKLTAGQPTESLLLKSFNAGGFQTQEAISVIGLCFRKGFWTKDLASPTRPAFRHLGDAPPGSWPLAATAWC